LRGGVSSDEDALTDEERATNLPAPANIPSQEEWYYRKPLLRRANLSPEESSSSYKACLRRSWCLQACVCSDKDLLTVEARATNLPAPANIRPQEERLIPEAQLRW